MLVFIYYCSYSVSKQTQKVENGSSSIKINNDHPQAPPHLVEYKYCCYIKPEVFFLGEYWSSYAETYL